MDALWSVLGGSDLAAGPDTTIDEDGLHAFRYRVAPRDFDRAADEIAHAAERLEQFLDGHGGTTNAPTDDVAERYLGPVDLVLTDDSRVPLAGRADRIDDTVDGGFVVTDFKTGRAGSGLQLAVYGWLRAAQDGRGGPVRLLYASTRRGQAYEAVALADDGVTDYTPKQLRKFLVGRLGPALGLVAAGAFPSRAAHDDHDPYCALCGDLVVSDAGWQSELRGERARALTGEEL